MKLIVCLDDRDGMLFNGRRQSMDTLLRRRMLEVVGENTLRMNAYSADQFAESNSRIVVGCNFLSDAQSGDYCFAENVDIAPYAGLVDCVIIYRWNRIYPSDKKFPTELFSDRWKLIRKTDFPGNSHEILTEEVYAL